MDLGSGTELGNANEHYWCIDIINPADLHIVNSSQSADSEG